MRVWSQLPVFAVVLLFATGCGKPTPTSPINPENSSASQNELKVLKSCDDVRLDQARIEEVLQGIPLRGDADEFWRRVQHQLRCTLDPSSELGMERAQARADVRASEGCVTITECAQEGVTYCGAGSTQDNRIFGDLVFDASPTLNDACCQHDQCYREQCVPRECIWSPQSKETGCDRALKNVCDDKRVRPIIRRGIQLWKIRFGGSCDVIGNVEFIRTQMVCIGTRALLATSERRRKNCDDVGGIRCGSVCDDGFGLAGFKFCRSEQIFTSALNPNHTASFDSLPIGESTVSMFRLENVEVSFVDTYNQRQDSWDWTINAPGSLGLGFTTQFLSTNLSDSDGMMFLFPEGTKAVGLRLTASPSGSYRFSCSIEDFQGGHMGTSFYADDGAFWGIHSDDGIKMLRFSSGTEGSTLHPVYFGDILYRKD